MCKKHWLLTHFLGYSKHYDETMPCCCITVVYEFHEFIERNFSACLYIANCIIVRINAVNSMKIIAPLSMCSIAFISIRQEANPRCLPQGGGTFAN